MRQQLLAAIFGKLDAVAEWLSGQHTGCKEGAERTCTQLMANDDLSDLLLALCGRKLGADALQGSLLRGYTRELTDAICKVLAVADPDGPRLPRINLTYIASAFCAVLPAHEKGDRPPVLRAVDERTVALLKDPFLNLHNSLHRVRLERQCYSSVCTRSRGAQTKLLKCSKCRLAQYCSRECQKADWRCETHPHKEICDMLQELFVFTTLDASGETFSAACVEHEFPLERVDRLIAWTGEPAYDYAGGTYDMGSLTPEAVGNAGFVHADYTAYHRKNT